MKKPKLQIKTIGGPVLNFEYGWSSGKLYKQGKIGVEFHFGNDAGCVITPESIDDLIEFFTICKKLLHKDNSASMRNLRKQNRQWYADPDMEKK